MEQNGEHQDDDQKRDLTRIVLLAAELADATPKYGERAFDKLLDFLLRDGSTNASLTAPRKMSRGQHGGRKPPKVDTAAMERIKAILEAPPELAAGYSDLRDLDAKAKVYTVLSVAREKFGIDGLTTPEIRGIAKDKFRVGIADGTLTSILSKAPATEIGRTSGKSKENVYKLLQAGDLYLEKARAKVGSRKSRETTS